MEEKKKSRWLFYLSNAFVWLGNRRKRQCRRENLRSPAKFNVIILGFPSRQVLQSFWNSLIIQQEETEEKDFKSSLEMEVTEGLDVK